MSRQMLSFTESIAVSIPLDYGLHITLTEHLRVMVMCFHDGLRHCGCAGISSPGDFGEIVGWTDKLSALISLEALWQ